MLTIYVDADACPVKEEVYRVARRYAMRVIFVASAVVRVPADVLVRMVVRSGFGAADDWIAEQAGPGDIVVTADIPLAARCLEKGVHVLDPKGHLFTDNDIGSALALRGLLDELRQAGAVTGGPARMTPKDRSTSSRSEARRSTPWAAPTHRASGGEGWRARSLAMD